MNENAVVSIASESEDPTLNGKYRPLAELGTGGMANVYLALATGQRGFHKLVVLKVLRTQFAREPDVLAMFMDEGRLAARLNHPNVVQTYEVSDEWGVHMIVMEYLDGQPLNRILARARETGVQMPLSMHMHVLTEALAGLHHAHELTDFDGSPLSVVHRDVSPHNLFVTFEGQVKVLDFGIAKARSSSVHTETGVIKGKLRYMAPEQFRGKGVDRRADLFSVGAMIWEGVTGERLWKGTDLEIMHRMFTGEGIRPLREVRPEAPEFLDRLCRRALAWNPAERPANALELQTELERGLSTLGPRVTNRELGAFVSSLFDDVRRERKRVVEAQIARVQDVGSRVYKATPLAELPHGGSAGDDGDVELRSSSQSRENGGRETGAPTSASVITQRPGHAGLYGVVAGGVLLTLGGAALWLTPHLRASEAAVTSAAPAIPAPPAPTASSRPVEWVTLTLATKPPNATVFFDDVPLSGVFPVTKALPRDGLPHRLRIEARGFAAKTFDVVVDHDRTLEVTLDRVYAPVGIRPLPPVVVVAPPPPAPASATPSADPRTNVPAKKPTRPIDTSNPWE